jgi:hypothetical protein
MLTWLLRKISGVDKPIQRGEPAAEAIIARAISTYSTCTTYSDRGTLTADDGDPSTRRTVTFSTLYRRPVGIGAVGGGLRFEHSSDWTDVARLHGAVWSRALPQAKQWSSIKPAKVRERSATLGLAAEQGVSFGAPGLVVPMLDATTFDGWMTTLTLDRVRTVVDAGPDEAEPFGRACDVVEGDERGFGGGGVVRVSVCRQTGLALRIARTGKGAKAHVDNWVALLDAKANVTIRDDDFDFTPPTAEEVLAERRDRANAASTCALDDDNASARCGQGSCA